MPLFVTTIITIGPTPNGFGVYPLTYVNETQSAVQARDSALADAMKSDPNRTIHDTATSRVPDAVVKAGVVQSVVATSAILTTKSEAGTVLSAYSHAGLGSAEAAKSAAVAAAQKAYPDASVAHISAVSVPGDVLLRAVQQVEDRGKKVTEDRSVIQVQPGTQEKNSTFSAERFAESTINWYRKEASLSDADQARKTVLYEISQQLIESKAASKSGTLSMMSVASETIDTYRDHRREGMPHAEARAATASEIGRRFNEYRQERDGVVKKEREQVAAL